jgi:UDP-3-O-[3-hydroxymyristoyl] N-acetylglucosamine deacetylase
MAFFSVFQKLTEPERALTGNQMQKTLKRDASISGIGLFTGEKVLLRLLPAPANSGIVFQRVDLPTKPCIPARLEYVSDTMRCTRLSLKSVSLIMVEHLLSALSAFDVDNVLIQMEGSEIPAGDGSSQTFVDLLEQAGVATQGAPRNYLTLKEPIFWSEKDTHLIALPDDHFRISYTLHYPRSPMLRSQYLSLPIDRETYSEEIAPCRTFSLYEEIAPLIEKGYLKGGGLENAVVIQGDRVLNPEGVRFADEMVRHKILDLIGDLSLLGKKLKAHIVAIRSGHSSNIAFAKKLMYYLEPDIKAAVPNAPVCLKGAS